MRRIIPGAGQNCTSTATIRNTLEILRKCRAGIKQQFLLLPSWHARCSGVSKLDGAGIGRAPVRLQSLESVMSSVSGVSGYNLYPIQQYQNLFNQIDTSGSGSITESELEQAVTSAGGTTQAADALYSDLDPNNTGSVSEQQFVGALAGPPFSSEMQSQMLGFQAQGWPASLTDNSGASSSNSTNSTTSDPGSALTESLFSQIDTNGDGSISQDELSAFLASQTNGQTAQLLNAADGIQDGSQDATSASATQPQVHHHHHHHGGHGGGNALDALVNESFDALDTNGDGTVSADELAAAGITIDPTSNSSSSGSTSGAANTDSAVAATSSAGTSGLDGLLSQLYTQMDTNGDGQITSSEKQSFDASVKQAFAQWASEQYSNAAALAPDSTQTNQPQAA
jgi:Ca2+-binding EF-hand superfamily protein